MNKRGFTLVEILVAVVLIGLIFGIGIPGVMKISDRAKKKSFDTKKELIEYAATLYGESNKNILQEGICNVDGMDYNCKLVTINELIEEGYLENDNKNSNDIIYESPINGDDITGSCVYIYVKNNRVYSYYPNINEYSDLSESCKYTAEINYNSDVLLTEVILGNKVSVEDYDSSGNSLGIVKKEEIIPLTFPLTGAATNAVDSGIFSVVDNFGTSYVFRGTVRNNYVSIGGILWKILRISGDGSIRLIYAEEEPICNYDIDGDGVDDFKYKFSDYLTLSSYINYEESKVNTILMKWYQEKLVDYDDYLYEGEFCNDRKVDKCVYYDSDYKRTTATCIYNPPIPTNSTDKKYYNLIFDAINRVRDGNPNLTCADSDKISLKIGISTVDELMIVGSGFGEKSNLCYNDTPEDNNINDNFWTMTAYDDTTNFNPGITSGYVYGDADMWYYDENNNYLYNTDCSVNEKACIRPVINLNSTVMHKSGNGTKNNPYTINTNI